MKFTQRNKPYDKLTLVKKNTQHWHRISGITGGGADRPGWHHRGGWHPNEKNCDWIYKEHWTTRCQKPGCGVV